MELQEQASFNTIANSSQGVCFDGTHYYVSTAGTGGDKLLKYNTSGTKVAERDCSSDGTNSHLGDLCVVSGVLYVTSSDYPTTPYDGYVKEYNASDLTYRNTEYSTHSTQVTEGIDWDGSNFWTVTDDNLIQKWASGFTSPTTYTPDWTPSTGTGSHGWQGLKWYDGDLYLNVHEGAISPTVQRFTLDGTDLKIAEHYPRPRFCSQGFDIVDGEFILALRGYALVSDAVVTAKLFPFDYRQNTIAYGEDVTERSKSSTSYTEDTNLVVGVYAKKWDLVRVEFQANFRVSGGSLRAYTDLAGSNTTDSIPLYNVRSMRTNSTTTEGVSRTMVRHYLAQEDGVIKFAMFWRQNTSGTIYVDDKSMTVQVTGKSTD